MEAGRTVGQPNGPTNLVGNWDVTVTVKLTVEGVAQNVAEQLCATSLSMALPASGWLREVEVTSGPSKEASQIQTVRPVVMPPGGKGKRG